MQRETRRKVARWLKITLAVSDVIVILLMITFAFINVKLNKIKNINYIEAAVISPEVEYFEIDEAEILAHTQAISFNDIVWPADSDLLKDKDILNMLLIGQDKIEGESKARSDTIMIATVNKKNNSLKVTSLMRDLYVQIPGYSDNRINSAYTFGGMKLLNATIEKNFGIPIDGNIEVDFNGFQEVINQIGGIELEINAAEAIHLREEGFEDVTEGKVLMNGPLALAYAQTRSVGNADYERTERQRYVMTTAFNKIRGLGPAEILKLTDMIFPLVTTDLTNMQIMRLAATVTLMGVDKVETYRIPIDGAYKSSRIRQMAVLVPDLSANRSALSHIIYGD